jgi:hypothetical protein
MNSDINELFLEKIKLSGCKKSQLVRWLIGALEMSQESAYRRMRGVVPFTLNEACCIAQKYRFSLDELMFDSLNYGSIPNLRDKYKFLTLLKNYLSYRMELSGNAPSFSMITTNNIGTYFAIEYDNLFKLFLYRYTKLFSPKLGLDSINKLSIPPEIIDMRQQIIDNKPKRTNHEIIIAQNLFSGLSVEIDYLYKSKQITDEEMQLMKDDLNALLDKIISRIEISEDENGNSYNFYISCLNLDNLALCSSSDKVVFQWNLENNLSFLSESGSDNYFRDRFSALKNDSCQISQSNRILRMEFIEKQREFINKIGAKD